MDSGGNKAGAAAREPGKLSTEELLALLFKTSSLAQFLDGNASHLSLPSFHEYIAALCAAREEVPEHVIQRAGLEKSFGHQLFSGRRTPSRDTVIQLAFGFSLTIAEAQELLKVAGKSPLYPRVKRDSAIIYCLYHAVPLVNAQVILYDLGLPALGEGRKK